MRLWALLWALMMAGFAVPQNSPPALAKPKQSLLIHVTQGPENPTRAALAFLVAKAALEEGHSVSLFLAGDAVQLIRDEVLDQLNGLGTGSLRESFAAVIRGGGRLYLSAASSKARGVTEAAMKDKSAEFATPAALVRLVLSHDRALTY
jgi:uncharacterized protein